MAFARTWICPYFLRADEVDVIAAYCDELRSCYAIPVIDFPSQSQIHLRLGPTRNGQRAALHFASDYPLGAVAQLAERVHGMHEARGSNPLSSISAYAAETVGAHDFRNLFGWYMQRAAAGEEFLVTRRGKPFARLSPPELQSEASRERAEKPTVRLRLKSVVAGLGSGLTISPGQIRQRASGHWRGRRHRAPDIRKSRRERRTRAGIAP